MSVKEMLESKILSMINAVLPNTTFDRLVIERRRRINRIEGCYPEAIFLSKRKSDKKYCVVRYERPTFDLMAAGIQYVFCYHLLSQRGYIPILDIEYIYSFRQGQIGEYNIWDECFEQPVSAREAATQPYVLAAGSLFTYSNDPVVCMELNHDAADHFIHVRKDHFREYYAKANEYVQPIWTIRKDLLDEFDEELWNKVRDHRVLGVFLRENFSKDVSYKVEADAEVYSRHPLLPGVKETIEIIKNQLSSWNYDYIFLSTMYADSVELFRKEFGDKVICVERERINTDDTPGTNFSMGEKEEYDAFKSNLPYYRNLVRTYLKEIIALSRCDYLLGGASSGMAAALVMNGGKYQDIYILEDERNIKRY